MADGEKVVGLSVSGFFCVVGSTTGGRRVWVCVSLVVSSFIVCYGG